MKLSRLPLRFRIAVLLVLTAVAIAPSAILLDRIFGREVLLISPHDEVTVKLNRSLHAEGDAVAEIYGNPLNRPVRVVLWTEREVIRPVEDTSLALLPMGGNGSRPLQVQTVFFVARYAILALLLLSLVVPFFPFRRRRLAAPVEEVGDGRRDARYS